LKDIKVRKKWKVNPVTKVHKDKKSEYNRAKVKKELQEELEDLSSESHWDDLDYDFNNY
jgi:hypothetical protein